MRVMPKALAALAGQALACIEDTDVIPGNAGQALEKILTHLDGKAPVTDAARRPPCRAPPQRGLFDEKG
jgi:hypothetical protein